MEFSPFRQQQEFLLDNSRVRCLFAAKRGGKSEAAYVDTIIKNVKKNNYLDNGRDPYLSVIIAPTQDMLTRLVWPKFRQFAGHWEKRFVQKPDVFEFTNGSILYGISAEKINRMEGLKLYHVHLTEAFQMKQTALLESMARTTDTKGSIVIDGSLGPQLINPKLHWLYRMFKEEEFPDSRIWEWRTIDNPFIDKEEIERQKNFLDPVTFRSMYEICWDTMPLNAVYADFSDDNILEHCPYNPSLPTYVCVDWGWAHPMAVGWFQYDEKKDTVYLIDEIVKSSMTLQQLYAKIKVKPYRIDGYYCDIAGNQEREQTGISNVKWFREKGIHFKYRAKAINYGIPIVRSYIKNSVGKRRFYVASQCKKCIDGLKQYRYPEKDGMITRDLPLKENDDAVDMIRYFFHNRLDSNYGKYKSSIGRIR